MHTPKTKSLARIRRQKRKIVGFVGGYLIDDGALTLEDLDRGIQRQLRLAQQGHIRRLGQVLVDMGYVTTAELKRALYRRARDEQKLRPRGKKREPKVSVR